MLSAVVVLAAQTLATHYLPDAKLRLVSYGTFQPVLLKERDLELYRSTFGCSSVAQWKLVKATHSLNLTRFDFHGTSPKFTVKEVATRFHDAMHQVAVNLDSLGTGREEQDKVARKFAMRAVSEVSIGPHQGWKDAHEDLTTGSVRRYLAWDDGKSQWQMEVLNLGSELARRLTEETLASIVHGTVEPGEAAKMPLQPQAVPSMGVTLQSPAVLGLLQREGRYAGGTGLTATATICEDFDVTLIYDTAPSTEFDPTERTVYGLRVTAEMAGYQPQPPNIVPLKRDGMSGHLLRQRYTKFGTPLYGMIAVLQDANRELIVHVHVSEACGGKTVAERIMASVKVAGTDARAR